MFNLVFFEPEIPPNTGNAIRLCSNTGCTLHLIKPLGFSLEDKKLRRAGLDYHEYSAVKIWENWANFVENRENGRVFAFSTKGEKAYSEVSFQPGDFLLFGPETRGLPDAIRTAPDVNGVLRLPMLPTSRSLNLANAAAVVVYEAWRQQDFAGKA